MLLPTKPVSLSSVMLTAPSVVLNVRLPKFTVPAAATVIAPAPPLKLAMPFNTLSTSVALSARLMLVPLNVAFPLSIVTLVAVASVMLPADVSTRLSPVLVPVSTVSLSSVIATAPPVVLNVRLPKLITSPALSPIVMLLAPALKLAVPGTVIVVFAPSVMAPLAVTVRLPVVSEKVRVFPFGLKVTVLPLTKVKAPMPPSNATLASSATVIVPVLPLPMVSNGVVIAFRSVAVKFICWVLSSRPMVRPLVN